MNLCSILVAILVFPMIGLAMWWRDLTYFLFWLVVIYEVLGACILILVSIPIKPLQMVLASWLGRFVLSFPGRGAVFILLGCLLFGFAWPAIVCGCLMVLCGLLHLIVWIFFRGTINRSSSALMPSSSRQLPSSMDSADEWARPNVKRAADAFKVAPGDPALAGNEDMYEAAEPYDVDRDMEQQQQQQQFDYGQYDQPQPQQQQYDSNPYGSSYGGL